MSKYLQTKYLQIIASEEDLKWWWDYCVPPLKPNEIYFVSLSLRKKKLTDEQKAIIPHNEMFSKTQIRHDDFNRYVQAIRSLEQRIDAHFPVESIDWIHSAIVCYWNICPIDIYNAMKDQMQHLNEIMMTLTDSALKNSQGGIEQAYYKVRKSFDTYQSLFARNFGTKYFVDFDIDGFIDEDIYGKIRDYFYTQFGKGNTVFVKTAGGMHCLVRRTVYNINPQQVYSAIHQIFPEAKEVIKNENQMCPLVGTWQYRHPVVVLNKDDITEKIHV